ncbi:MAG: phosphoribosyl-ATP diphosphatase [Deltaproteobacteria bacterium]|nr:phosphoribosyl-ATP diphosphatase [Deltaproteobacteria bacterium]
MDEIKWDERGLVPVVVQDMNTKDVLMVAYMNQEAFDLTLKTGKAHYYSRSRNKLWLKGDSSRLTRRLLPVIQGFGVVSTEPGKMVGI